MNRLILVAVIVSFVCCEDEEPVGEKISFKSPDLNEEEQMSSHLPKGLGCDACTAISHQITKHLSKAEINGKKLKESEYLDIFETICSAKTWERLVYENLLSNLQIALLNILGTSAYAYAGVTRWLAADTDVSKSLKLQPIFKD